MKGRILGLQVTWLKSSVARSSLSTQRSTSATFPAAAHCSTRAYNHPRASVRGMRPSSAHGAACCRRC